MRQRAPELEAQLLATANAADRANRPRLVVIAPALLLVGAMIFALVTVQRLSLAKGSLQDARSLSDQVDQIITQTMAWRANRLPVELYVQNPFMADNIDEIRKTVMGSDDTSIRVGSKQARAIGLDGVLQRADVDCQVGDVPLDALLGWIEAVEQHPDLSRVFVAQLELRPSARGWSGTVRFRRYEKTR
ncbi:MAG: hypothetical protein AAFX05_09465 [Planctomycetota bacterium]